MSSSVAPATLNEEQTMNSLAVSLATTPLPARANAYPMPLDTSFLETREALERTHPLQSAVAEAVESLRGRVLLVEDSDDDAMLFSRAVQKSGRDTEVYRASNVAEALALLAEITPSLITLDCNLKSENGLDLLRDIRKRNSLRAVPIVMLSGTESESDVQTAYELGANSFLRKPSTYDEYVEGVQSMLEYWLDKNCASLTPRSYVSCLWLA